MQTENASSFIKKGHVKQQILEIEKKAQATSRQRKSRRLSNKGREKAPSRQISISSSLDQIDINKMPTRQVICEDGLGASTIQKYGRKRSVNEDAAEKKENAKKAMYRFLGEDLNKGMCQQLNVKETIPPPVLAGTEESISIEQNRCSIAHSPTLKTWTIASSNVLTVTSENTVDFKMWKLNSTVTMKECYIFASDISGTTQYVSVTGEGDNLTFMESSVKPASLNLDASEERNDPRAFYYEKTGTLSEGRLVPAMYDHLALNLVSTVRDTVRAQANDGNSSQWIITVL